MFYENQNYDIEEIKNKVSIVDVAAKLGCEVNRIGFMKSIYKEEKNPSLKIYDDTNSFYCFATGNGGDVIKFYMDATGNDFITSVKELSEIGNVSPIYKPLKREQKKGKSYSFILTKEEEKDFNKITEDLEMKGNDHKVSEEIAYKEISVQRKSYQKIIYESLKDFCGEPDRESIEYLTGPKRGLNKETIKRFGLFCIKDVKAVREFLEERFTKDQLLVSGLYNREGNFVFTNNKIIIPYYENGEIVYLRGRKLPDSNNKSDDKFKYVGLCNFAKNLTAKRFFNRDLIRDLKPETEIMICEGEFDCMRAVQEGIKAIGLPGINNFPENEIEEISKYEIILCFDNDEAGMAGADNIGQRISNQTGKLIYAYQIENYKDLTEYLNDR